MTAKDAFFKWNPRRKKTHWLGGDGWMVYCSTCGTWRKENKKPVGGRYRCGDCTRRYKREWDRTKRRRGGEKEAEQVRALAELIAEDFGTEEAERWSATA